MKSTPILVVVLIIVIISTIAVFSSRTQNLFILSGGGGDSTTNQPFILGGRSGSSGTQSSNGSNLPTNRIPPNAQFPGGTSGNINWLGLLQAVQAGASTSDKYKIQLAEIYINYSEGKYDSVSGISKKPSPSLLFVLHQRETNNAMFLQDKVRSGELRLDEVNRTEVFLAGAEKGSGGLYKDNGEDGEPDGPYQIEKTSGLYSDQRSKDSKLDFFDTYSMIDQMNNVSSRLVSTEISSLPSTISNDLREVFLASHHNRGSSGWMIQNWGIKYRPSGADFLTKNGPTPSTSYSGLEDLYDTFKKEMVRTNADLNIDTRKLPIAFMLANGWFIDDSRSLGSVQIGHMGSLFEDPNSKKVIDVLFPDHGNSSRSEFEDWVKVNYVKNFCNTLGITSEFAKRVHNMGSETTGSYYYMFKPTEVVVKSDVLTHLQEGESTKQVYIFDIVNAEYILSVTQKQPRFLEWLLKEGLLDVYAGTPESARELFDPYNPVHILQNMGSGFNPNGAGPAMSDAVELVTLLGSDPQQQSEATMKQLEAVLSIRGGLYDQTHRIGRGTEVIFKSKDRGDLQWTSSYMEGQEVTDCSSLAHWGYTFGNNRSHTTTTMKSDIGKTNNTSKLNGVEVKNYLIQIKQDGSSSCTFDGEQSLTVSKWGTSGFVKPGDILITAGKGHVETVISVNNTNNTIEVPASYHYRGNSVTLAPQAVLTMGTGSDKKTSGLANFNSIGTTQYILLRPAFSEYATVCP